MKKIKFFSNVVLLVTLVSPMVSFAVVASIGETEIFGIGGAVRYSWVMFLFIPFGIASMIIGTFLNKRKEDGLKNIVVALICVPLLLIFGSFRFMFSNITYDKESIAYVEEFSNINLPDDVKIVNNDMSGYTVSYVKINSQEEKAEFEKTLESDYKWEKKLNSRIMNSLPFNLKLETENFDYFIFYSNLCKEYNSITTSGKHEIVYVAYDSGTNRLVVLSEYVVELD